MFGFVFFLFFLWFKGKSCVVFEFFFFFLIDGVCFLGFRIFSKSCVGTFGLFEYLWPYEDRMVVSFEGLPFGLV